VPLFSQSNLVAFYGLRTSVSSYKMKDKKEEETFPEENPYAWTNSSQSSIDEFLAKANFYSQRVSKGIADSDIYNFI
jgi:hypothetical protein